MGVSHRPGFGLLGSVPRSLSTQPPFATQALIPQKVIVNIHKAFILPHFEYFSPVLGLSNKLTNQYAIRSLLNMSKSSSYRDLLTHVDLKSRT